MPTSLTIAGGVLGLLLGPVLAGTTVRLASGDPAAGPGRLRVIVTAVASAAVVAGAVALAGARPATIALAWFGAAAVVLAGVDLAAHRLPDRVTAPAAVVGAAALLTDAVVTGTWGALLRAVLAAAVALGVATAIRLVGPGALGRGDVKLLGLVGLVLGWAGWGVLVGGVLAGLLVGALASLMLVATGRAGWRTRVPFGPPLLVGAWVGLWLGGPLLVG